MENNSVNKAGAPSETTGICRKSQKSIRPAVNTQGPLQMWEEGWHASDNEGYITDNQDDFDDDPKTDAFMGMNYKNSMMKTTYYLDLSTLMDWKNRYGKRKKYESWKHYNIITSALLDYKELTYTGLWWTQRTLGKRLSVDIGKPETQSWPANYKTTPPRCGNQEGDYKLARKEPHTRSSKQG